MREASTTNTKIINIRVIAASENIEETIKVMIDDLSLDFELLKQSKPYPSRHNTNEVRIYLEFIKRKKKDAEPGNKPRAGDVVKGGGKE